MLSRRARQTNGQGSAEQLKRDLKITTSSVQRLSKELELYERERDGQAAKVAQLRADSAEAHDIKRAVRTGIHIQITNAYLYWTFAASSDSFQSDLRKCPVCWYACF